MSSKPIYTIDDRFRALKDEQVIACCFGVQGALQAIWIEEGSDKSKYFVLGEDGVVMEEERHVIAA